MTPFWISWYTPRPMSEFELHSPWWVSGYADAADGTPLTIVVAAVLAVDAEDAWEQIAAAFDEPRSPSDFDRRFCEEHPELATDGPFSPRWPKARWMAWSPSTNITCACPAHLPEGTP